MRAFVHYVSTGIACCAKSTANVCAFFDNLRLKIYRMHIIYKNIYVTFNRQNKFLFRFHSSNYDGENIKLHKPAQCIINKP